MDGPVKHCPIPLRPVPVYGQRFPVPPDYVPTLGDRPFDVKKTYDSLTLAKHLEMIALINHQRTATDFHSGQRLQFPTGSYNHMYAGFKMATETEYETAGQAKVNTDKNVIEQVQNETLDLRKKQLHDVPLNSVACIASDSLQCRKPGDFESPVSPKRTVEQKANLVTNGLLMDKLTVPVLVSCANPLASQYGYGRKVFPCPQCRYTTDRRNNLKRHMLTMHQTCSKTLECCGIVFATKASLREHAMIFHYHGYTCYYCGRRFCRKALLKRHLSVHNGQKDFVCSVCDYATSHKSNLERHRKVHCRTDDDRQDKMDCESDHVTIPACVWGAEGHRDIYSVSSYGNSDIVSSSSDDENVEINVVSD